MAYINAYIEACEAFGFEGGPEFSTRVVTLANGFERRNGEWAEARRKYTLPFQNIDPTRYANILNMFYVAQGMLNCFRYRDPLDHDADNEIFAVAETGRTEYQLLKVSNIDGFLYRRNVYAIPESASIVVTVNGVPTGAFQLDRERGLIDFDAAPANGAVLRWTGDFDVWVRFDQDYLPFSIDNKSEERGYAHNGQVVLLEMPAPQLPVT